MDTKDKDILLNAMQDRFDCFGTSQWFVSGCKKGVRSCGLTKVWKGHAQVAFLCSSKKAAWVKMKQRQIQGPGKGMIITGLTRIIETDHHDNTNNHHHLYVARIRFAMRSTASFSQVVA